ncbi:MAG: phosphatase PAP2 family protein [Pseudomonadota bacterium]|nr:phosphatase PAP2 family protein [Pseudomonadota bacterium]
MFRCGSSSLGAFWRARLAPDACLGRHVTAGVLVLIVTVAGFWLIAEKTFAADAPEGLDLELLHGLRAQATPAITQFMRLVSQLHSTAGIAGLGLLAALYAARLKAWDWLLTLVLTVPAGMLFNRFLKEVFQRTRPVLDGALPVLDSYSFPSGHTAAATLLYGVLAAWLVCRVASWRWRLFIVLMAMALVALVGLSRIYLGEHYPSDVLAATVASSGFLALSLAALGTWRRRRTIPRSIDPLIR